MKIVSLNVNGLKAKWDNGLPDILDELGADIYCFQESRLTRPLPEAVAKFENSYWAFSDKKGYAGVTILTNLLPISSFTGIGIEKFDSEGRVLTLEFEKFYLVTCYVPNSVSPLSRYHFRLEWDRAFRTYLDNLKFIKPVIVCGDFNVAYEFIDVYPENDRNKKSMFGLLAEEKDGMMQLLELGLVDCFRHIWPNRTGAYTWWSSKNGNRNSNHGRRLDYFLASEELISYVIDCDICPEIRISDHSPIFLEANI